MAITARKFEYNSSITAVSQKQFDIHLALYNGYVSKANEITSELLRDPDTVTANATYSKYRGLKVGETYALDGVILHELYFQNIGQAAKQHIGPHTEKFLNAHFGGFDAWARDFTACALSARGWCVLVFEQRTQTLRNLLQDAHNEGIVMASYPLLILDMYEHAYYVDYPNKKSEYISAFMKNINWDVVERRIEHLH